MLDIGLDLPKSKVVNNFNLASKVLKQIDLPAIIRPAFTLRWSWEVVSLKIRKNFSK